MIPRLGFRRPEAGRSTHEWRAALLQPGPQAQARPEESVEDLARFFQMIYDTARSIKPDALVEWCPCGTSFNFYTLPNLNMSVASDPHSSWQVRTKGKIAQGPAWGRHCVFRRSCGVERWPSGLRVHGGDRRRRRDAVHLAGRLRPPRHLLISRRKRKRSGRSGSASTRRRCCRAASISASLVRYRLRSPGGPRHPQGR